MSRFRQASLALLAGLAVAGCNSGANQDGATANAPAGGNAGGNVAGTPARPEGRIVLLTNGTSPFWLSVEKGMQDAAKETGARVDLIRNDGTVAGQIQKLEQVSAQGDVKGVSVSMIDSGNKGIADRMNELRKKGVHVITMDSDGPKETREAYIGANNVVAGRQAGEAAARLMPEGGKVVAFVGTMSAANAVERLKGFKEGAGPKFQVVDVMEDGTDTSKARQNVTAAIQAHPDAKLLLGLWSYNAPAIAEEVTRAGKADQYTIVTFDAEPNTINQLQKGVIDATVIQQPYQYGALSVRLLHALINNDQATVNQMVKDGIVNVPTRLVVPTAAGPIPPKPDEVLTVEELVKYLNEKGLKGT